MKFELTAKQEKRAKQWLLEEAYPKIIKKQKRKFKKTDMNYAAASGCWEDGFPYGVLPRYSFVQTGIGLSVKVSCGKYQLDITEYDLW